MAFLGFKILLCLFAIGLAEKEPETFVVETDLGPVRGLLETVPGTEDMIQEFRGIRFGKPTSRSRRFKKPEPFGAWSGELDATKFSPACSQMSIPIPGFVSPEMSEDCLALNIYVPTGIQDSEKRSVMVWIHGGGFIAGHSHQYDGKRIAVEGGVIVVTINYRLGLFGFLSLDHPAAKGNYAVWDQKLALQWVHDNIGAFGGDPNSVTVFGESAGGWSTNVQSLIPSNKGLFQRAIAQSGALHLGRIRMPTQAENHEYARYVANKTGCVLDDQYKYVDCLRSKSEQELLDVVTSAFLEESQGNEISIVSNINPTAVIDGELFKGDPFELLEDPNSDVAKFFKSIHYMSGVTTQEGSLLPLSITPKFQEEYGFNITDGIPGTFICKVLVRPYVKFYLKNYQEMEKLICDFYQMESPLNKQPLKYLDFYGDILITHPVNRMIDYHASFGGLTWQYVFSRESSIQLVPQPPWYKGAGHGDDLFFMFPAEPMVGIGGKFSEDEKELSKTFIQYWTSFAKSGVPSGGEMSAKWKLFKTDTRHYMDFDIPIKQKSNWAAERMELLNKFIKMFKENNNKNKHTEL